MPAIDQSTRSTNIEPLTEDQIEVMERVRTRLADRGLAMTDAEMVSYGVIYRRLRQEWSGMEKQSKPHPLEVLMMFAQEEEGCGA